MHELSVTENILKITLRHAEAAGAQRVTNLFLVVGQLASIVDDSVQFYWDIISQGTPAEGAVLHFKRIPAVLECQDCGQNYTADGESYDCPACGGMSLKVTSGEEFYLDSIEVE